MNRPKPAPSPVAYAKPLLKWFDRHQRDLPWRAEKTPYRIWVSEIMLQQTQVKTVIDYYQRFIKRFPSVLSLAQANEAEVLKLWEGLGYYRRARQLHAAAKQMVARHAGQFPEEFADVLSLPGIGRYTAGAILSISRDQRLPILEGNTIRLFSRLLAMTTDPRLSANQTQLWKFAESILPARRVGDFNQALMELGSEICTPRSPACDQCPLQQLCPTLERGWQNKIPAASKKMQYEAIEESVIVLERNGKYLVRACQPGERWAGLYDFPRYRIDESLRESGNDAVDVATGLAQKVRQDFGLVAELRKMSWETQHAVTRFRIKLYAFESTSVQGRVRKKNGGSELWATLDELAEMPMSVTGRRLVGSLRGEKPSGTREPQRPSVD